MPNSLISYFSMNGYGIYIWPAYLIVITLLAAKWYAPWRRQQQLKRRMNSKHE